MREPALRMWFPHHAALELAKRHVPHGASFFRTAHSEDGGSASERGDTGRLFLRGEARFGMRHFPPDLGCRLVLAQPLIDNLAQEIVSVQVRNLISATNSGFTQCTRLRTSDRPLLRKGIVAGKNPQRRSLILDSPIYFGDSGGPVFEIDRELLETRFRLIGVVREYVPFAESTCTSMQLQNSGYSVAAPMDAALNLIQ
jgi:hypothetical protein